jgi:cytidine deaminase
MELMNPSAKVTLTNLKGDTLEMTVADLLPYSFKDEDMNHE